MRTKEQIEQELSRLEDIIIFLMLTRTLFNRNRSEIVRIDAKIQTLTWVLEEFDGTQ